jgi:hypothetical protein
MKASVPPAALSPVTDTGVVLGAGGGGGAVGAGLLRAGFVFTDLRAACSYAGRATLACASLLATRADAVAFGGSSAQSGAHGRRTFACRGSAAAWSA